MPNFRQKQISVDEGKQIIAFLSENAKVKAKLTAPYMRRKEVDSPYVEFPNTLHVDFYNDSLVIESIMNAHYGKWREQDGKVYLRDSVVVMNILKGDTLYCRELWWDQKAEKFYTDKPVQIHKSGGTILMVPALRHPRISAGILFIRLQALLLSRRMECRRTRKKVWHKASIKYNV